VVLEGNQVQTGLLGQNGEADRPGRISMGRSDEGAEQQRMTVIGHHR
jgi:hypothetical protein